MESPLECIFCNLSKDRILAENELAMLIRDAFPVSNLHSLIIPKRHIETYFDMNLSEVSACNELLIMARTTILDKDNTVEGFNIGINSGEVAGQTIFHCHIHLIPRRKGDVENPRGGIRNVIAGKGFY